MAGHKEDTYHSEIDILRIVSIFSVVLIHTTSKILDFSKFNIASHPFALFLNQISRFAVPLFFMISAFVLEHNYSQKFNYLIYLKKRFSRLLLPYLFWSLIYYYFIYPHNSDSIIKSLFIGSSSYQLYFIPTLFIFYLIYPLLSRYLNIISHWLLFIILLIVQFTLLSIDYYFKPLSFAHPINVFLLNFMFFIFGMLASHHHNKIFSFIKKYKKLYIIFSLLLAIYIYFEGALRYFNTQNYLAFSSQWRPSVFLYTIILSSLLFYFSKQIKINPFFIKKISSYTFFVFFIHVIFIEIIWKILPVTYLNHPLLSYGIVLIPSYICAFLFSKIPKLSKLTG